MKFKVGDKVRVTNKKKFDDLGETEYGKKGTVTHVYPDRRYPIIVNLKGDDNETVYDIHHLEFDNTYLIKEKLGIK